MNEKKQFLEDMFYNHLLRSDLSVIHSENIRRLNEIALEIYQTANETMSPDHIEGLKVLLYICNVLYNRTDMDQLPIEDGFYDLLLEKYKVFDPNFQVGSAVVQFQSQAAKEYTQKPVKQAIHFVKDTRNNSETNEYLRAKIMRQGLPVCDMDDLKIAPLHFDLGALQKKTHDTAHEHPSLVGTLDKCKFVLVKDAVDAGCLDDPNVKILERDFFQKHIERGIISPNQKIQMVLELKYDGVSVEADCTNVVESARSRGDTGIGVATDITDILKDYPFKHARCRIGEAPIGVKFEAIMTKTDLQRFCEAKDYNYANCRTAIVGLFGGNDSYKFRDYITLIPLAVDRNDLPQIPNRMVEIEFLNQVFSSNGEPLRYCFIEGTVTECLFYIKKFVEEAKGARPYLNFMYDGVVVSYLDEEIRETLGRENYINKYSMAIKFDPLTKMTMFRGYTYEVGQDGRITPMIHYDPVEFIGTIHTKSSGSSLQRFKNLGLRYGDLIEVTYRNDVMPYVTPIDCEHNRNNPNPIIEPPTTCPECGTPLVVSSSGKMLLCPNRECHGQRISRTSNMLAKLNLKGFSDSSVRALDKFSLRELVNLDRKYLLDKLGFRNGEKFYETMQRFMHVPIKDYQIMGAIGFSNVGPKKWMDVMSAFTIAELLNIYNEFGKEGLKHQLELQNGIGDATSTTISEEFHYFWDDIVFINGMTNVIVTKGSVMGKQIRFSGCRNKQLEEQLRNAGYDADSNSSVTKDTDILLVPYADYTSVKTRKMKSGIIVPIQDFMEDPSKYLQ